MYVCVYLVKYGNINDATERAGCFIAVMSPADANVSVIPPELGCALSDMPCLATAPVNNQFYKDTFSY